MHPPTSTRRDHPPGHRPADRPRRRPRPDPRRARLGATRDDQGRDHRGRRMGEQRDLRAHRHRPRREGRPRRAIRPPLRRRPSTGSTRSRSTGSGRPSTIPTARTPDTELLKITVQGTKEAAGRAFSSRMVELALSSYPGLYSLGPPQPGSGVRRVLARTARPGGARHTWSTTMTAPPRPSHPAPTRRRRGAAGRARPRNRCRPPWTADELVVAPLGEIVHARSGDKGGDANLGVWVRNRAAWEWLTSTLTVDELRRLLPETRDLAISRYELPNLGAVNFVLRGLLGPAPPRRCGWTHRQKRSANGCAHATPRCRDPW